MNHRSKQIKNPNGGTVRNFATIEDLTNCSFNLERSILISPIGTYPERDQMIRNEWIGVGMPKQRAVSGPSVQEIIAIIINSGNRTSQARQSCEPHGAEVSDQVFGLYLTESKKEGYVGADASMELLKQFIEA